MSEEQKEVDQAPEAEATEAQEGDETQADLSEQEMSGDQSALSETGEVEGAGEGHEGHVGNQIEGDDQSSNVTSESQTTDESAEPHEPEKPEKPEEPKEPAKPRPEDLDLQMEAALLTTDKPLTAAKLAEALGGVPRDIREVVEELNHFYQEYDRSFRIELIAGGYQLLTLQKYKDVLLPLQKKRDDGRLTAAALETLSIIAYEQPMIRAEIESIRGVACGEVLKNLLEKRLIKIVGRSEELGRPMLYGTTKTFLEVFGLANLKDLPSVEKKQNED